MIASCHRRATARVARTLLVLVAMLASGAYGSRALAAAEAKFAALAEQVAAQPEDMLAANELRRVCRQQNTPDSCVDFFDKLVARHPNAQAARYNAALAYIDSLPGHSLLAQAKLSTHSMAHASAVLERRPHDWLALYIRGLNNLYWPKWYRRADRALADLRQCTQLTQALPAEQLKPYMAIAYVALGDAYVKLERLPEAQEAWRQGANVHASQEIQQRLALPADRLVDAIDHIRSREVPVDTDLSFYASAQPGSSGT